MRRNIVIALCLAVLVAPSAFAASNFQNTCSNIQFVYSGSDAAVQATCLKADGSPNSSKLVIQGIGNQNGKLVQGSGASTFQKSCGNIQIEVKTSSIVTLSALCRTSGGSSNQTSIELNGINNNNGNLSY
jgi:hypothetical protein